MDVDSDLFVDGAMRAFDQLESDGPRTVQNVLKNLATESKEFGENFAPGRLAIGWRVEEMADPATSDTFGYAASPTDKPIFGGKPVARWVDRGTGSQASAGIDANPAHAGQRAQRFMRKAGKRRQVSEIHKALVRTARKAGFNVGGVS